MAYYGNRRPTYARSRRTYSAIGRYRRTYRPTGYAIRNQRMIGAGRTFRRNTVNTVPAVQRTGVEETKVLDIPTNTKLLSTTATFTLLNPIQEGTGLNNRVGRKVSGKSLRVTGQIIPSGNAAGGNEYLRILILYDRQPGPLFPVIADILQTVDQAGSNTTDAFSNLNPNNMDRFAVLRDMKYDIPSSAPGAGIGEAQSITDYQNKKYNFDTFIKIPAYDMHFSSTANPITNANVATGAMYLVTFGTQAAMTAAYQVQWTSRLRYKDC